MTTSELLHPLRRAPAPGGRPASPRRSPISPPSRTADRSADPSWARPALIALLLLTAVAHAGTRWILAAGTMIGLAFLAKMMQAFLVLPAFALVYLVAAPTPLRRRVGQMLAGGAAVLVSAGWWVAIVALWPTASRPMIDGSSDNSILNLIVGYNGLGRILGSSTGGNGASFSGETGVLRLFNEAMGGQSSWLLPVALLALLGGLLVQRRGLPLGRGHLRIAKRSHPRARNQRARDGNRRLQQRRRQTQPRRLRAIRCQGAIHYYIVSSGGAGGGPGGRADATSAITTWVKAHYTAQTIGGQAVYELTKASS